MQPFLHNFVSKIFGQRHLVSAPQSPLLSPGSRFGKGKAYFKGKLLSGKDAMDAANIKIPYLEARDGLAVINGSNFTDGLNTLNIGYYLLIGIIVWYLNY